MRPMKPIADLRTVSLPIAVLLLAACLLPLASRAAEINLATLSCDKYENEMVGSPDGSAAAAAAAPAQRPDSIDTVMWLFGYSVGKAGEHVMYGDALTSFGFALDAECRNNPSTSLLQALAAVRPKRDKPMDLMTLNCKDFESRHAESMQSDASSANTIMMWLFGYSVAQSGSHVFDASKAAPFAAILQNRCTEHPEESLYEVLMAVSRVNH
jgi:HdeA/HdeB family